MTARRKKEWFDDADFWTLLYPYMFSEKRFSDAAEKVDRIIDLVKPAGFDLLDLCCGPGRFAVPFAQQEYSVTGVDKTDLFLDKARERAEKAHVTVEWVKSDMRDFVRPESFDVVLNMFTSFGYFSDRADDLKVMKNIYKSLRPHGTCLFDLAGKEVLAMRFEESIAETMPDGTIVIQKNEITGDWEYSCNQWILIQNGKAKTKTFCVRLYSAQELKQLMRKAGFSTIRIYGSLAGTPYGINAKRLIACATK